VRVIGLTGGIASGKSTVARSLAAYGAAVIDADALGHEVYAPGTDAWQQVRGAFGAEIIGPDGRVDRGKLGAIVFADRAAMKRLTDIVWPAIKAEMTRRIEQYRQAGEPLVVVEAAVLLEAGWDDMVDEVWTVAVPPETAVERLTARTGLSEEEARRRVAAQMSNAERAARATCAIENTGSLDELARQVELLWRGLGCRAA
jgi:dephospho-CoA kinase